MAQADGERLGTRLSRSGGVVARLRWVLPRGQTLPEGVWVIRHRCLLGLLCLHAVALPLFGATRGYGVLHAIEHGAVLAVLVGVAHGVRRSRRVAAVVVSLGLITSSALLVHVSGGVIEAHFHFFVMIVVLALYEDWLPFLVAAAYVVVHHGVAGALDAQAVYNHPDAIAHPWKWALIHGGFVTAAGVASIVTWRLNEAVRAHAEMLYRQLVEAQSVAQLGSWEWNVGTDVIEWSEELCRIYGVDPAAHPARLEDVLEYVHPQDRAVVAATVEASCATGEAFGFDHRIVRPDGTVRVLSARGDVVLSDDGRPLRVFGTAQDVTEHRDAEEAQRQLAAIVKSTQDAVIAWALDGALVSWNRGAQQIYGYRAEEVLGKPITMLASADSHDWGRDVRNRIRRGDSVDQLQSTHVRNDGRLIDVALTISPVRNGAGQVTGASAIARDISEQKLRERYLKVQHEATRVLAQAATVDEALPVLLQAIGEGAQWDVGAVWMPSGTTGSELRCQAFWHRPGTSARAFEAATKQMTLAPSTGLPGCVWTRGTPRWVKDVTVDPDSKRSAAAAADGLRTCILLPVLVGAEVLAVFEFLSHDARSRDAAQLELLDTLSAAIAQFLVRKRADEQLAHQAHHDALTGLPNRRKLVEDLELALTHASHEQPLALLLLDLDGFKVYNDTFGHSAGDALLTRLGRRLADDLHGQGTSYRMGGDEFCVIASIPADGIDALAERARAALTERGDAFSITASCGAALLPDQATRSSDALRLADRMMYATKGSGNRASAARQSADVLLQVLCERSPELGTHLDEVTQLCKAVAEALAIPDDQMNHLLNAAALHDVGKAAIPEAILVKPGPLDADEWAYIHRHTIMGQRILSAAPALAPAAKLVRSSHEHLDGSGYPDGLAGDQIPLGARIIAVCDAYEAMTANRPYRTAMSTEVALSELRACAGSQFDPTIVDTLTTVITRPHAVPRDLQAPNPDT